MGVLRPVVEPFVLAVLDPRHDLALGRPVRFQLVGDHDPRGPALPLQQLAQQALGRLLVAPALDQHVEHHPVLVDRPPEIVGLAGDLEHDLVEMPFITGSGQPPADEVGELLAELEAPLADGLVADLDATEGQHLLDHKQAERKPEVQPNRVADQLRRKAVAGVGGLGRVRHDRLIPDPRRSGNPTGRQLDMELLRAWRSSRETNLQCPGCSISARYAQRKVAMEQYVGLDVSLEQTSIYVIDGAGKVLWQGKSASTPEAIAEKLRMRAPHA